MSDRKFSFHSACNLSFTCLSNSHAVHAGITRPTIHQLTEELADVNWHSLGMALLVPVSKLSAITASHPQGGTARWKIELLQYWLDSTPTASWSDIIKALEKIGHGTLSARLKTEYLPSATTTTTGMRVYISVRIINY